MNRLTQCFSTLKQNQRKALAVYIVAGDPDATTTLAAMETLVEAGVDIIELGVPFSDPMAEGPVIQKAHERALAQRQSLRKTLTLVSEFRKNNQHTPVVFMGYANPFERFGYQEFARAAIDSGVDGLLTVDLPPEEAVEQNAMLKKAGLETIFLLAPTSSQERMQAVSELAGGFIYYVSLKGVTGAGHLDPAAVAEKVQQIRQYSELPICVGFGIKDGESAKAVGGSADGVVVGSALVEIMGSGQERTAMLQALSEKARSIRTALDSL